MVKLTTELETKLVDEAGRHAVANPSHLVAITKWVYPDGDGGVQETAVGWTCSAGCFQRWNR